MTRYTYQSRQLPPIDVLEEWLSYCPESGRITWKKNRWYNANAGDEAGCICSTTGYRRIRFGEGRKLQAHRVAWILHYKQDPLCFAIDHIDGNRANNRISNLRLADRRLNGANRKNPNASKKEGALGVYPYLYGWKAGLRVDGRLIWLGTYKSEADAVNAWELAAAQRDAELSHSVMESKG